MMGRLRNAVHITPLPKKKNWTLSVGISSNGPEKWTWVLLGGGVTPNQMEVIDIYMCVFLESTGWVG